MNDYLKSVSSLLMLRLANLYVTISFVGTESSNARAGASESAISTGVTSSVISLPARRRRPGRPHGHGDPNLKYDSVTEPLTVVRLT